MAKDGNTGNPAADNPETRMWGGRFAEPTDAFVARFTASVDVDKRLYHHDIRGSIVHANGLRAAGVLDADEHRTIVEGLEAIGAEVERDDFDWDPALEDEHRGAPHRTRG